MQEAVTEYIHTHVNSTVFECSIRVPVTSRAGDDRRRLACGPMAEQSQNGRRPLAPARSVIHIELLLSY
jgi:hypothetical protein